jgi:hypothetical protein
MSFVRKVYQAIVDTVWDGCVQDGKVVAEDTETTQRRVVEAMRTQLVELEKQKVPLEEFVYTRGLASKPEEYKNMALPHVQVCN